jgi:hypothetical protein
MDIVNSPNAISSGPFRLVTRQESIITPMDARMLREQSSYSGEYLNRHDAVAVLCEHLDGHWRTKRMFGFSGATR